MNNQTTWFSAARGVPEHRSSGHGAHLRLLSSLVLGISMLGAPPVVAVAIPDIAQLSLEQLLDVTSFGASKCEPKQREVAAAVSVATRCEIKAFG